MLNANMMLEATRLTRAGRALEAAALLQRMIRGETAPDTSFGHAVGPIPPTIGVKAGTIGEPDRSLFGTTVPAPPDRFAGLRTLFERVRRGAPAPTADIVPPGGKFIEASCSNAAGTRAYKLFIPSRYQGQALPLVVMLHGCTQSPDDFAAGTRMNLVADEQTCFVAYPAQPSDANPAKCWNWFRPGDQRRGQGEPSLIADITRKIMREYAIDPSRIYIAGLSAGGAAAAIMGATYPDLYAAVGVHSGLACGAASDLPSAYAAMRQGDMVDSLGSNEVSSDHRNGPAVPIIVFHGDRDTTVHPRNGDHVIGQSTRTMNARKTVHEGQVPGGHSYTRTIHADPSGRAIFEHWDIHGAAHAWSGGSPAGSYTDPRGPDATHEMLRFFLEHRGPTSGRGRG